MPFQAEVSGRGDTSHAAPDDHDINFIRHLALVELVELVDSLWNRRFVLNCGVAFWEWLLQAYLESI